jgi:hypothetical protein
MNMPTQTNDAESGIFRESDEGSSCLSRRNMILGGAAVVAAIRRIAWHRRHSQRHTSFGRTTMERMTT